MELFEIFSNMVEHSKHPSPLLGFIYLSKIDGRIDLSNI